MEWIAVSADKLDGVIGEQKLFTVRHLDSEHGPLYKLEYHIPILSPYREYFTTRENATKHAEMKALQLARIIVQSVLEKTEES